MKTESPNPNPQARSCSKCGAALATTTLRGLCPKCLALFAFADEGNATVITASPPGVGSSPPAASALSASVRYFGNYELLDEVARGGMGVVYRARQASLNRTVALKMILAGQFASAADVQRFRTEAEAAANLQHPNIVTIHEVGEHEGRHYFSMDYVEGKNLGARLKEQGPLTATRAAELAKTLAEAVHYAHQRGTLHRDLKPQNILMDPEGRPRITDFGLAKRLQAADTLTATGAVMGSPSYMSPEQAQGRNDLVGPASDVYSLGAVLYEMLTGRPPFLGDSPMATMHKVMNDEPPRLRSGDSTTPTDLETICLKCLEKDPSRRYPTARALAEDLARFLAGDPVQARPASRLRRAVAWSRRHRSVTTAVTAAVLLALVGLAYGLWEQTQYLTWLNAHPGHVKVAGPRTAAAKSASGALGGFGFIALMYAVFVYNKLSRGVPWKQLLEPATQGLPAGPIAPGWALAFVAFGVAGVISSFCVAAQFIAAFVWEGSFSLVLLFVNVYPLLFFGLMLLLRVIREQAGPALGLQPAGEPSAMTAEQTAPIYAALFAGRPIEAIRLYREATGLSLGVAHRDIAQITAVLYRKQPEKFAVAPGTLPELDLVRAILLLGVGGLVFALLMFQLPEKLLPSWPVNFLIGTLWGLGVTWVTRVKKGWHRVLVFLCIGVFWAVASEFNRRHHPEADFLLPFMLGIFAGIMLIRASVKKEQAGSAK